MDALNLTNLAQNLTKDITNNFYSILFNKIKPAFYLVVIIAIIYLAYKITRLFLGISREKRIKKTYENTEKILEKLDYIEKKMENRARKTAK